MSNIWPLNVLPGADDIDKFGRNPVVGTGAYEDVWLIGGTYTYDSISAGDGTGFALGVSSAEAADTQTISLQGLDADGNPQSKTVALTGRTEAAVAGTWSRVFRMGNEDSTDTTGQVYAFIAESSLTDGVPSAGDTRASFAVSENQSMLALWTMPRGKQGFITQTAGYMLSNVTASRAVTFELQIRKPGGVFRTKRVFSTNNDGSTAAPLDLGTKGIGIITELSDIKIRAIALGGDQSVAASFHVDYWDYTATA